MKDVDVSKSDEASRIIGVVEQVLRNVALRVLVDGAVEDGSDVAKLLDKLRERPNMHFVAKEGGNP